MVDHVYYTKEWYDFLDFVKEMRDLWAERIEFKILLEDNDLEDLYDIMVTYGFLLEIGVEAFELESEYFPYINEVRLTDKPGHVDRTYTLYLGQFCKLIELYEKSDVYMGPTDDLY